MKEKEWETERERELERGERDRVERCFYTALWYYIIISENVDVRRRKNMVLDGQMMAGGKCGLNFLIFSLQMRKKPGRIAQPGNCPDQGSNPGPLGERQRRKWRCQGQRQGRRRLKDGEGHVIQILSKFADIRYWKLKQEICQSRQLNGDAEGWVNIGVFYKYQRLCSLHHPGDYNANTWLRALQKLLFVTQENSYGRNLSLMSSTSMIDKWGNDYYASKKHQL